MKKIFTILSLLVTAGLCNAQAQTFQRIHLQGSRAINLPVHLVDRASIVEEQGVKHLRVLQQSGKVVSIALSQIDSITHVPAEELGLEPTQLGELGRAGVMGVVRNEQGEPVFGARVQAGYGSEETITDINGVFVLENMLVYKRLGYVTITKAGFHQASRSFLPLENGANRVNVQLLSMTPSGTFNAGSGGTVTSGLLKLNFPANSISRNGQAYTGAVSVYARALDPASAAMFEQMPGDLLGGMNDSLRLLRSFGMASIELRDANMNELELAEGSSATLTFSIPSALQADAPETIDWWSFDETLGYWRHEGEAQKQGTQYVGTATHFSWWNCDVPQDFNNFLGKVIMVDGNPISDAQVNVVTPNLGTGITYTNAEGEFSGRVPKNQELTLNIFLTCETTSDWDLVHTENISSAAVPIVGQYQTSMFEGRYPITGTVVNCTGQPVSSGYVKMGPHISFTKNGPFNLQTCSTGDYVIRGYDMTIPDSIKASDLDTVQVGPQGADVDALQACSEIYGSIADIEGNVYPIVLIGSQWWMAENLNTATYANGESIPNVTSNISWTQLNTGAWCYYENNAGYGSTYGKLYNWYAVADPRKVCPAGWHVPSHAEWDALTSYLGGGGVAGSKMKSTSGWDDYEGQSGNGNNESGFSGLPSGNRDDIDGSFFVRGLLGRWWSSSEFDTISAYNRELFSADGIVYGGNYNKGLGFSIRCLRD